MLTSAIGFRLIKERFFYSLLERVFKNADAYSWVTTQCMVHTDDELVGWFFV